MRRIGAVALVLAALVACSSSESTSANPAADADAGQSSPDGGVTNADAAVVSDASTVEASDTSDPNADTDGDCIPNGKEPAGDLDGDGLSNALDPDSDNDGLNDGREDKNCNGAKDPGETSAYDADSDADGATDLIEVALATDPLDAASKPPSTARYVVVPGTGTKGAKAKTVSLSFKSALKTVDLYVLLDRSGSMSTEITAVKNNLATVVSQLLCAPAGTGAAGDCIPDLWAGAGTFAYSGGSPFTHAVDVSPSPSFSGVPVTEPASSNTAEATTFAVWSAITGKGSSDAATCTLASTSARATCAGSAAANAGNATSGYPCFRAGAIPVIAVATDEAPLSGADTYECPDWPTVVKPAATARGARVIGVLGDGASADVTTDLGTMATDTRAVDARNANAPIVVAGAGAGAPTALKAAILTLLKGAPIDLSVVAVDDGSDAVDAPSTFIERFVVEPTGASCTAGLTSKDTNADSFADTFVGVPAATPVCWSLVTKATAAVAPTQAPQVFRARIDAHADGFSVVDSSEVVFVVPPAP